MRKYYAYPVLFDLIIGRYGGDKTICTNLHGIYLIEYVNNSYAFAYLLNKERELAGTTPAVFNYRKYATNSWLMNCDNPDSDSLDYREGIVRVIIHPLPVNSKMGRDIRAEFNDIPTKTEQMECNL